MCYEFLGNIRELENMIEWVVIIFKGKFFLFVDVYYKFFSQAVDKKNYFWVFKFFEEM